jgi:hypothetical protein
MQESANPGRTVEPAGLLSHTIRIEVHDRVFEGLVVRFDGYALPIQSRDIALAQKSELIDSRLG